MKRTGYRVVLRSGSVLLLVIAAAAAPRAEAALVGRGPLEYMAVPTVRVIHPRRLPPITTPAANDTCWYFGFDADTKNGWGKTIWSYHEEWKWCSNGSVVTKMYDHDANFVSHYWGVSDDGCRTSNQEVGHKSLKAHGECHGHGGAGDKCCVQYDPETDVTVYPNGAIEGRYYSNGF